MSRRRLWRRLAAVHPHVCGEHALPSGDNDLAPGSSPRVWGTSLWLKANWTPLRFIPTCVGNIFGIAASINAIPVHPHVCGEHKYPVISNSNYSGSSPRVWGTSQGASATIRRKRFIPTCVGNIWASGWKANNKPVHPHVCGEHLVILQKIRSGVRFIPTCVGNMKLGAFKQPVKRFIPTCVGNIYTKDGSLIVISVHPHVCGEHVMEWLPSLKHFGSSPRVWGTFKNNSVDWFQFRFIPTCVGNISL